MIYTGIDSEQETTGYQSDGGFEDEGYGVDEEEQVDNFRDQYSAIDDYICQLDDTITKEDFYNGRDSLDDYIERGIDDTNMTGIEVDEEMTKSSTILYVEEFSLQDRVADAHCEEDNCALPDTEISTAHILGIRNSKMIVELTAALVAILEQLKLARDRGVGAATVAGEERAAEPAAAAAAETFA